MEYTTVEGQPSRTIKSPKKTGKVFREEVRRAVKAIKKLSEKCVCKTGQPGGFMAITKDDVCVHCGEGLE